MKRILSLAALFLLTGCTSSPDSPSVEPLSESLSSAAPELPAFIDPDSEEGPHPDAGVEWWFFWGFVTDADGEEWSVFTSFFRLRPEEGRSSRYVLYDLTNLRTGERTYRSAVGKEAWSEASEAPSDATLLFPHEFIASVLEEGQGDVLSLDYGKDRLQRTAHREYMLTSDEASFFLRSIAEPMTAEGTGLVGLTRGDDMKYYTFPRLEAQGTIRGKEATGTFWYDHQWGDSWTTPNVGWAWWVLQLDDGSDVVAYVLRDTLTGEVLRTVATQGDEVLALAAEPLSYWESSSGVRYPVSWNLVFGNHNLTVEPYHDARKLAILGGPQEIWDGPVRVSGTATGKGFQELLGYLQEQNSASATR